MLEQRDQFPKSLDHSFQTSEKIHAATPNEQIRILLEQQKEQILADCRAEIQKHEFQVEYDRRSIQKLNETIESQRDEINRVLTKDEQLRRDQKLLHIQLLEQNRELREAHVKSPWDGRIEAISRLNIRWIFEKKINRRSRNDPWTHKQDSGIAQWRKLYEWFEGIERYWISTPTWSWKRIHRRISTRKLVK